MNENQSLINWILKVAVGTLASICIVVVAVLMIGIFMPNEQVNNDQIFEIIGPAFNTVIGAFVGLLGGLSLSRSNDTPAMPEGPEPEIEGICPHCGSPVGSHTHDEEM